MLPLTEAMADSLVVFSPERLSAANDITIPGVQKPHWMAPLSTSRILDVREMPGIDPFYGNDMLSMGIAQRHQAGDCASVGDLAAIRGADKDSTCPAVAFTAPGLGPGQAHVIPYEVKQ